MRLIDADKLYIDMMDRGLDHLQADDLTELNQIIDEQPTIYAQPVVHAKWLKVAGMNAKCLNCGNYFPVGEFETRPFDVNYCIWCGAKMD